MKSKKLLNMLSKTLSKEKPMLNLSPLVKMAKENREFARALMQMTKTAKDKDSETSFNETVPAASQPDKQDPNNEQKAGKVEQPVDNSQVEAQAQPQEMQAEEMPQQDDSPVAVGVRAAQSFIGPEVFQAALAGDTNAMDLLSRVAGQIASSTATAATQAAAGPQMDPTMQQAGLSPEEAQALQEQGGMGEVAQTLTPEEQVADLIVAPQEQPAAAPMEAPAAAPADKKGPTPPGGEPKPAKNGNFPPSKKNGGEERGDSSEVEGVDSDTLAKIVKLVKSGKL